MTKMVKAPGARRAIRGGGTAPLLAVALLLVGTLFALSVTAASALAATPETPTAETPTEVGATAATLHGLLNPAKEGAPGTFELATYEFVYRPSSKNECEGTGETTTVSGMALGAGKEEVAQTVEGLTAGTHYAVCLVVHNASNTALATSTPVSFTTPIPPEAPITQPATEVTGTSARLSGILNPNASAENGSYVFSYEASDSECRGENRESAPPGGASSSGAQGEAVTTAVSGLLADTTYTFCLVSFNSVFEPAEGTRETFTTPAIAPTVSDEQAEPGGAGSATITTEINPNGLPTTYHAEYVTEAQFAAHQWAEATSVPLSDAGLPALKTSIPVTQVLTGLEPGTTYEFRFLATSSLGAVPGAAASFTTLTAVASSSALPDGRVDELVSTSGAFGEPYEPPAPTYGFAPHSEHLFQAALNGDSVAYVGESPLTGGNGTQGSGQGNEWLASRTPGGWETNAISPPATTVPNHVAEPIYQWFSSDLATAIIGTFAQPSLAPEAPVGCDTLYSRDNSSGSYAALFTSTETPEECGLPLFSGASQDGTKVIFQSEARLLPNAPEVELPEGHEHQHSGSVGAEDGQTCSFACNLYERDADGLHLVNVLPGGAHTVVPSANFGGYFENGLRELKDGLPDASNAISTDGSRIFWTDTQAGPDLRHVYVLEDGTKEVQVSGSDPAEYWTATPDGRYALYTEDERLWRFDTLTGAHQELAGVGREGEPPAVVGVLGTNSTGADASYIYFVAENRLAENASADKEQAASGRPNLYLLHEGATTFIATLSTEDNKIQNDQNRSEGGDWAPNLGARTAEITGDGRHLVFQSSERLTGYDNTDAEGGAHILEVFVYDADRESLSCASCDPTGAPPRIKEGHSTDLPTSVLSRTTMRRWMSESGGRVFFDFQQALVPQDTNAENPRDSVGGEDVYEWEAEGEGTCDRQAVPRLDHGCVSLLSGGDSEDRSFLVDADATGENVFFEHRGVLGGADVSSDRNELYDARVDGGFPSSALACTGTGCQGVPPAPPLFATPASVTFSGVGNLPAPKASKVRVKTATRAQKLAAALKACAKNKHKRGRASCRTRARKRYGAKVKTSAHRAGNQRRAQS
jgi:hypothetical protein